MHIKPATNDNTDIGQRLRMEMKKRGLSSVELAKRADVKTSFLYDVISGKSANPSSVKLARVSEALGVSLAYLAGSSDSPLEGYQFSIPSQLQDYVAIPRLLIEDGAVSARDNPQEQYHFSKEWIKNKFGLAPSDVRLMVVMGDNMSPTLNRGDMLLVDMTKKHPSPPGIFVLFDGMALVPKRVEMLSHGNAPSLRISCDNPHYSTYESPIPDAAIIGRVIWFSRDL